MNVEKITLPIVPLKQLSENSQGKVLGISKSANFSKTFTLRLISMGFVEGSPVTMLKKLGNNFIVQIKGSRYVVGKEVACAVKVIKPKFDKIV